MTEPTPVFLSLDEVLLLHELSLKVFGGQTGIRERRLVESAVAQPQLGMAAHYVHAFPHEMAAAYGYHLARNHPFLDGNKRTAWSALRLFLLNNGYRLQVSSSDAIETMLAVASGTVDKPTLAEWVERRLERIEVT